jgi:hypothetical protein
MLLVVLKNDFILAILTGLEIVLISILKNVDIVHIFLKKLNGSNVSFSPATFPSSNAQRKLSNEAEIIYCKTMARHVLSHGSDIYKNLG